MLKHSLIPLELKGLKLADPPDAKDELNIDILIGNDHYGKLVRGKIKKFYNESLITTETKVGWLLSGSLPKEQSSEISASILLCQETNANPNNETKLDQLLSKFWEISLIPEGNNHDSTGVHKGFENTTTTFILFLYETIYSI